MIKLLCFTLSLELRELEAKLRAGYMNKERAAQLAEKQILQISIAVYSKNHLLLFFLKLTVI